jgi:hypothetical protein
MMAAAAHSHHSRRSIRLKLARISFECVLARRPAVFG